LEKNVWESDYAQLYITVKGTLLFLSHFTSPFLHLFVYLAGDYQNGFRDGRSVIDNIFALIIINGKIWEYNQSVQYLFTDFQKAYGFIHTYMLWKCMEYFKIPTELICMCKTCVQKTGSVVSIEGTLSYLFENKTGLKQDDFITNIIQFSITKSDTK
jgi:hypothetical protein